MPGVHRDFGKLRHNTVDPKGLVPELPGFHHGIRRSAGGALAVIEHQVLRGEPAVLSVRRCALIPGRVCLVQHLHQGTVFVVCEHLMIVTRPVPKAERSAWRFRLREIRMDAPDLLPAAGRGSHAVSDGWRHRGRDGSPENTALHEALPLSLRIDRMLQLELVFSVQGFSDFRSHGRERSVSVGGEIRAVRRVDTDQ